MVMELNIDNIHLPGVEKAAILMMCLSKGGSDVIMKELGGDDIRALIKAISTLGTIQPEYVERVIREFSDSVLGRGGMSGSLETARSLLESVMPSSRVAEIMDEIYAPRDNRSVWEEFSLLNEQDIANHLRNEQDQLIAAVLTKIKPNVAAAVLPHFGSERMPKIVARMIKMENLSRHVIQDIEDAISTEVLGTATRKSGPDPHQRMAEMFNKMDPAVFEELSNSLETTVPAQFALIKEKMFVFDDLIKMDASSLQRIMRNCEGNTLALALKGARKEVRDAFMSPTVMTERTRNTLQEEMNDLGNIKLRRAREEQNKILEITLDLVAQNLIRMPTEDEEVIS